MKAAIHGEKLAGEHDRVHMALSISGTFDVSVRDIIE